MRKVAILILMFMVLVACSQQNQGGSTTSSESETPQGTPGVNGETTGIVQNPPRVEATPTPPLPVTWTPPAMVHGGHLYLLPVSGAPATRLVHIVESGDTLAKLAARYNVSMSAIAHLNKVSDWDQMETGTTLVIVP